MESGGPLAGAAGAKCGAVWWPMLQTLGQVLGEPGVDYAWLWPQNTTQVPPLLESQPHKNTHPFLCLPLTSPALSPAFYGGTISQADPGGAKLIPGGSPYYPTSLHLPPNLGFNVYFLIRMPAMWEPPRGPRAGWGPGRVRSALPALTLTPGTGEPPRAGGAIPPLRVSDQIFLCCC